MTRRPATIPLDDIRRAVRAVVDCGLEIRRIEFHGSMFRIILADDLTGEPHPDKIVSFDDYKAWRDARGPQGHP